MCVQAEFEPRHAEEALDIDFRNGPQQPTEYQRSVSCMALNTLAWNLGLPLTCYPGLCCSGLSVLRAPYTQYQYMSDCSYRETVAARI